MKPVSTYELVRIKKLVYQDDDNKLPTKPPLRLGYLRLDALQSLPSFVRATDFYRSPQQQITALQNRKGAQWPGYSGHGEGLSVDLNVSASMTAINTKKKARLDEEMRKYGWVCHRLDGELGFECWHYNYLPDVAGHSTSNLASVFGNYSYDDLERRIKELHGDTVERLQDDIKARQWALSELNFYNHEIDGIWGKWSKAALEAFKTAWVKPSKVQRDWRRVLAFMTADVKVIGEVGADNKFVQFDEPQGLKGERFISRVPENTDG